MGAFFSRDGRSGATAKADYHLDAGPLADNLPARGRSWWLVASYTCLGCLYLHELGLSLPGECARDRSLTRRLAGMADLFWPSLFLPLGDGSTDKLVPTIGLRRARFSIGVLGTALAGGLIAIGAWVESGAKRSSALSLGPGWLLPHRGRPGPERDDGSLQTHAGTLWCDEYGRERRRRNFSELLRPGSRITGAGRRHYWWLLWYALLRRLMWMKVNPEDGLRE